MVSFKKAMALKTPEEIEKLTPKERKEYELQIQQEYKIKVHTLSDCCKKFEEYLEKTTDEPRNWHEKFKEIFSEYLNSKKHFSRTNSMIKDMHKKLSKAKYNWTKPEYYQNIFKFKAEKANKKGYIKRSAIDDKGVADIFNVSIPKAISDVFNRHKTLQNSQKGKLDAYSAMIVSKYLNSAQDMKNLEATNSNFKENSEKFKYNPVSLTKENRKAFENIETQYVYSTEDKIFTDGKIKKIHFVDANITVDVKDIGKKYNTRPLSKLNRWLLYKNIETQFIYSAEDPIYNDGKIKNHVICIKGKIPNKAFIDNTKLKEVTIQSGVIEIGEVAFGGCTSLEKITIPNSVNKIGYWVFYGCTSLKEVTIQSGVKEIGDNAFYGCTSLEKITIPGSVETIGNNAFWDCTSLEKITILNGVKYISWNVFKGCTSLKEVTIPSSVIKIEKEAFSGCTSLKEIIFYDGVNVHLKIDRVAFGNCPNLDTIKYKGNLSDVQKSMFVDEIGRDINFVHIS